MKDSQILSTLHELPRIAGAGPAPASGDALLFDACHVGVVLRAVLFVLGVASLVVMFGSTTWWNWVVTVAVVTAGVLPATLAWLVVACSLKRPLSQRPRRVQRRTSA